MNKFLLFLFLAPSLCLADSISDRDGGAFFGGGLTLGQNIMTPGEGAANTRFQNQGYLGEGGFSLPLGARFGVQVSGEFGQNNSTNSVSGPTYMETGSLTYYSGKGGFFVGPFTLGGGYRHNDVTIKSLSAPGAGYLESNYSGWSTLTYANFSLDIRKRYRTVVEAQYVSGKLSGTPAVDAVKFIETSISLRLYVLFD